MAKTYNISLVLQSPLLVGGKKIKNNILKSKDYIPGSVVRAAFAKTILMECPVFDPKECFNSKSYYVYYRDKPECNDCRFKEICKNFKHIKFSFFYPEGFNVIPLTARKCKIYPKEHGLKDILHMPQTYEVSCDSSFYKCSCCKEIVEKEEDKKERERKQVLYEKGSIGRLESARGFREGNKPGTLEDIVFTKTSINPYTGTAFSNGLYSIYCKNPTVEKDGYKKNVVFVGEINGVDLSNIFVNTHIYVGSKTTSGMGKMLVQSVTKKTNIKTREMISKRIRDFNKSIRQMLQELSDTDNVLHKTYIPMMLKSDAKLGIEKIGVFPGMEDTELSNKWKALIFGDMRDAPDVERVYGEHEIYRGFDTSTKREREPFVLTSMGTTVLFSTKDLNSAVNTLINIEKNGVGMDTENGYGQVEICNEMHLKGVL